MKRTWKPLLFLVAALGGVAALLAAWTGESSTHGRPNRLIHEKSPYLLQHAYNPVDWYPWGEEAFQAAREAGKPIFLSVGYSTCHWCHVMERESFSNPAIAAVMNANFICVKVDREERPDIDQTYMTFVQATTGSGGWPMSVFLTPDLHPFFGASYFPAEARGGQPGFKDVLDTVAKEWRENRSKIVEAAADITGKLKAMRDSDVSGAWRLERGFLDQGFQWYENNYDKDAAGFGEAPKFPRPVDFNFLLRYHAATGNAKALEMTLETLRRMAAGGIHDQLGGGFHRYSTDAHWFLPHFEKMLYDQAQLAVAYLEAFQISRDPLFESVARDTLDYVLSHLTDPSGGFYSAEDADSALSADKPEEKAEGAFYVWTSDEITRILGDDAPLFMARYGVQPLGNVKRDHFGEFKGKNVLYVAAGLESLEKRFKASPAQIARRLEDARARLLRVRRERPHPLLDDKVLTSWNGLMISAFARASQILGDPRYTAAARNGAVFLADSLIEPATHRPKRRWRLGEAAIDGFSDDYFFLIQALLDLYETTLESRWLTLAMDLETGAEQWFWDAKQGGFYNTKPDEAILLRIKDSYDGAEPAANSVAALDLLRLAQLSDGGKLRAMAEKTIRAFRERLQNAPHAMPQLLAALDFHLDKPWQILIAGKAGSADTQALLAEVHKRYLPNKVLFLADGGEAQQRLAPTLEILKSLKQKDGKATAYVCQDHVCQLPTTEPGELARLLDQ